MKEGIVILIIGVLTVFLALLSLFLVFQFFVPGILKILARKPVKELEVKVRKEAHSGEEIAAVSAAVYMVLSEVHDEENAILTIHQSEKEYSPWSSKIYGTHHFKRS